MTAENEHASGTAFCWKEDDGRTFGFLISYPHIEARGKTKAHCLYNLRRKLEKHEREVGYCVYQPFLEEAQAK